MTATTIVRSRDAAPSDETPFMMGAATALMPSIPDLLEPATHPNHRKFFHSVAAALLVVYGNTRYKNGTLKEVGSMSVVP